MLRPERLLTLLLGVLTFGAFGLAFLVASYGRRDRAQRAGAIVVLGARVFEGGVPSDALRARVEQAVALYQRGIAPVVVFTGGPRPGIPSEAEVAQRLAVEAGLPRGACVLEAESRTTAENARFAARILRARGALPAVVVSDGFHLLRARQLFLREGLAVLTSPAEAAWRNRPPVEHLYWYIREGFALLFQPRLWWIPHRDGR